MEQMETLNTGLKI